jgi:hypothetical protein
VARVGDAEPPYRRATRLSLPIVETRATCSGPSRLGAARMKFWRSLTWVTLGLVHHEVVALILDHDVGPPYTRDVARLGARDHRCRPRRLTSGRRETRILFRERMRRRLDLRRPARPTWVALGLVLDHEVGWRGARDIARLGARDRRG